MELSGDAPVTIGLDLMPKLGIGITGLAVAWEKQPPNTSEKINDVPLPNESPAGSSSQRNAFFDIVQPTVDRNALIPPRSFCTVPESVIHLDTEEGVVSHRRQYTLPIVYQDTIKEQVQQWLSDGIVEEAPPHTMWNSPLTPTPYQQTTSQPGSSSTSSHQRHLPTA
ncbi:hypothetical protein O0I10_013244 [Lichtheimia ornata]|uniref:Uncharacterized protein n=1 Tax=Lichtheimia ornata TaxID=688661 RepID=A0AAD7XNZ4_9FUNG|nr:uncharacterized protein O0I10_013244 [Lichtheimia ornata]KAJ8651274.1 hypothetical protein O0I10_013244 [Lichtheimia ornata]